MTTLRALAVCPLAIAVFFACASEGGRSPRSDAPIYVEITNNNLQDVGVYAVSSGQSNHLGIVTTVGTQVFQVPARFAIAGRMRVLVDPIGSLNAFLTDEVSVAPGYTVSLTVQPNLDASILTVR